MEADMEGSQISAALEKLSQTFAGYPEKARAKQAPATASLASCCATVIALRAARLGINLSKLEVAVESEGDTRGILGLDDRISAGMSALRTTVQIAADNAGPEQLEELVRWSDRHSPVGCTVREAVRNTLFVHTG